jgi:hypothetical protein
MHEYVDDSATAVIPQLLRWTKGCVEGGGPHIPGMHELRSFVAMHLRSSGRHS